MPGGPPVRLDETGRLHCVSCGGSVVATEVISHRVWIDLPSIENADRRAGADHLAGRPRRRQFSRLVQMRSSTTLEGEIVIPNNIIERFFGGSGAVSPTKAMAQGRTLRRFLYEPDLWQILGYGTRGGWLDGGCAILADALHEVLGPAAQRIMLTDARGVPQH